MRAIRQSLLALALITGCVPAMAQQPPATQTRAFVREDLASEAVRLEERLKKESASLPARAIPDLLRDAGQLMQRKNPRGALRPLGQAVAADTRNGGAWLLYSRAAFAAAEGNDNDAWTLRATAAAASYAAYQKAANRNEEANALAWLGEMQAKQEYWRQSLDAYRASLDRVDAPAVRAAYQPLRERYGFRVLNEKVDSDSASPRVCFPFSESLARGKVDFAPFVAVSGSTESAISTDEQQLCVEGLKHGTKYHFVLRQGLPSAVGESLLQNAEFDIYVRDRSPQVRFTGRNYVLPRLGQEGVPLVSVNTPKVAVDVIRIGDRNLIQAVRSDDFLKQVAQYRARKLIEELGQVIWTGTLDTRTELNQDVITAFPVLEAVPKMEPGVYVMLARAGDKPISATLGTGDDDESYADDSNGLSGTQWFVVSDLGLTAFSGDDGIHILTRSLASAEPLGSVELRLLAKNNEILATRTTGADGHVRFDPGLSRGTGGNAPSMIVATTGAGDYNFLDLLQTPFDLTDRGVKGRAAPKAIEAFVYAERGVYRSGETVNISTLLRDVRGQSVSGLPVTLVAKRPDGVDYKRVQVEDQGLGGRAYSLALLSGIPTGTWRIQVYTDPKGNPVGETTFLVEDYVPERLDLTLTAAQKILRQNEAARIDAEARWLYGAPGANLEITGEMNIDTVEGGVVPNMPGYVAGLQDEEFEAVNQELEESATTDARGKATVEIPIPQITAPRPVEAKIILRAGEPGGRAVERVIKLPIQSANGLIAVKKTFSDLSEGSVATFDIAALNQAGERVARSNLSWSLYRVSNEYQWYNSDGRWGFERVKSSRRIADGRVDAGLDQPGKIAATVGWGTHRLDIRSDNGTEAPTSITFEVGWSGDASAETPDLLQMTLDKAQYKAGEEMKVQIASRFSGKASIAIVGDKVNEVRLLDVKTGDNVLSLPVSADWGAGAYAVAIAHRPLDQAAKRMPGRALGLSWFSIDQDTRRLDVALTLPAKMEPRRSLAIPVRVGGLPAGEDAYVTLAAVDIGILNLTHYEAPDATKYFFGQRLLGAEIRDLYGLLIDGMQGARGAIRSGGDAAKTEAGAKPTQEPLSRYSGVVKVGADGVAQITFDIPSFNGSMRVMAVAWSKGRVGQASGDVIVRDPVVVQATLPRFLALGDQSRFFMQVDNVEAPAGDYTLDLDVRGPVIVPVDALRRTLRLAAGARTSVAIPVNGAGTGTAELDLTLSGQGIRATQKFQLSVQPGSADLFRRSVRQIPPGTNVSISSDLLADFIPGTGSVSVSVAPVAGLDIPALLTALDRYPYGCSEQTVSRALPLLYVNKLASQELMPIDGSLNERINQAIEKVLTRQDSSGAFGLWSSNSTGDLWLHAFVTDFLTRARENNFTVPARAFDQALDYMRNALANTNDFDPAKGDAIAYSAYVLARNGRPVMGDLRYLADTRLENFTSPLARAQLGAALALLGDRSRAQAVFSNAANQLARVERSRFSRADYGSRLRDSAGILALAAESNMGRAEILRVSAVLEQERSASNYTSTQENAWMILAAEAMTRDAQGLSLTVDGAPQTGSFYKTWKGLALEGASVTIGNTGQSPAQIVISTTGNPIAPEPAAEQGYRVEREMYKLDGTKIDPASLRQNDRVVVVLKVTELEKAYAKLLLVDRLPAGLEIDNPDLFDGGGVDELAFLKRDVEPTYSEYRDDRFVAALDRSGEANASFTLAYIARAVTPGQYVYPPAVIEDMYKPQRFGRTAVGSVVVSERR